MCKSCKYVADGKVAHGAVLAQDLMTVLAPPTGPRKVGASAYLPAPPVRRVRSSTVALRETSVYVPLLWGSCHLGSPTNI